MKSLEQAQKLHQELTVVDTHHDIPMELLHQHLLGNRGTLSGYWGNRLRAGGINVQVLPAYIEDRYLPALGMREIFRMVEATLSELEHENSTLSLATTGAEIDQALAQGRIAAIMALEGCDGLGGDPAILRLLYRLGVRMVAFTWDRRNEFADGTGVRKPGGLTDAGRTALKEMFAHNVICDVSHLAEPGFWDVMELAQGPIIASHSNARAICDHRRNLTDDQIRAIAQTGGIIGLNFYGGFVDASNPTLERMADHMEHMVELVGTDHICIGADFLETPIRDLAKSAYVYSAHSPEVLDYWIPNCQEVEELPRFTAVLLERGFSREDIAKILGGNALRVFRQVLQ
jgi:membrane dipeptidase